MYLGHVKMTSCAILALYVPGTVVVECTYHCRSMMCWYSQNVKSQAVMLKEYYT